jgi:hypothetical protein
MGSASPSALFSYHSAFVGYRDEETDLERGVRSVAEKKHAGRHLIGRDVCRETHASLKLISSPNLPLWIFLAAWTERGLHDAVGSRWKAQPATSLLTCLWSVAICSP